MLRIQFSRHAQRRAKLYGIDEKDIIAVVNEKIVERQRMEIIVNLEGYPCAIKIVAVCRDDEITIITCYPLKKELKK